MTACVPYKDSLFRRKIEKVNPHISSLEMPFKEAEFAIRASKGSFIAVHVKRGFTFARCVSELVDIKTSRLP